MLRQHALKKNAQMRDSISIPKIRENQKYLGYSPRNKRVGHSAAGDKSTWARGPPASKGTLAQEASDEQHGPTPPSLCCPTSLGSSSRPVRRGTPCHPLLPRRSLRALSITGQGVRHRTFLDFHLPLF